MSDFFLSDSQTFCFFLPPPQIKHTVKILYVFIGTEEIQYAGQGKNNGGR